MPPVIQVENLSKLYRLGEVSTGTLSHDLNRWWHRVRGKEDPYLKVGQVNDRTKTRKKAETLKSDSVSAFQHSSVSDFSSDYVYALKDINFSVNQGEVLGIIGRNGAGKSTLLKILSRVTAPSSGRIKVKGRIASLLEVGTGFHPELTGRENIYLNGAILGMSRTEVKAKFDEIVCFAGVELFLDTPVKRYSSGMYVRLAFAVAAHLEPEILVVDEVLAVGDAEFQRKCLGRMSQVASEGRTILFVSHNMVAVQSLCTKAMLLGQGSLVDIGTVPQVVSRYLQLGGFTDHEKSWDSSSAAPGNDSVRLARLAIRPISNDLDGAITMESPIQIKLSYHRLRLGNRMHLTFHLVNEDEVVVLTTSPGVCQSELGLFHTSCEIPGNFLNSGGHRLRMLVVEDGSRVVAQTDSVCAFSIIDGKERNSGWMGREPSAVQIPLLWSEHTSCLDT